MVSVCKETWTYLMARQWNTWPHNGDLLPKHGAKPFFLRLLNKNNWALLYFTTFYSSRFGSSMPSQTTACDERNF